MADTFAPKLSSDVRFNEPVEQPSMVATLASIGESFLGTLGTSQRGSGGGSGKPDQNLALFAEGLKIVDSVRQQKGELAAQIEERKLATNFAAAGINFNEDYKAVYETTTGRPWAGYGADYNARAVQATLDKPEVQAAYTSTYAINPNWSEEERVAYAINQEATLTFYKNEIEMAKTQANYKWTTQTNAAYNGAIDTFLNVNLGALVQTNKQGGRVGPQALANLTAQWSQYRQGLTRPQNVTDDQWQAIQSRMDGVDKMLENMTKAASSDVMFEEITTALAQSIQEQGGNTPEAAVASMVAIKSPETLANLGGLNINELFINVGKKLDLNVAQPSLFGHIIEDQGGVGGNTNPNAFLTSLPADIEQSIKGKTSEQLLDGLNASGALTAIVRPNNLQNTDARNQFVENAATIGAIMQGSNNEQFLSNDMLKKLVANPSFIRNVTTLDGIDPEAATVTRTYIRSGLNVELGKQTSNLGAIEGYLSGKGIVWNGVAYVLTPEAEREVSMLPSAGGMGGIPINKLQENQEFIKQATDRRSAIETINSTLKTLEVKTEDTGTTTGSGNPVAITPNYRIPEEVAKDTEFLSKVSALSNYHGIPQEDMLRVIEFETAGSWSPAIQNPNSTATGLIQFMGRTAANLGTSTEALANMTRSEQMAYVSKYLEPFKGRIKNFGDLYMAIHWPKAIGKGETYVMYEKGSPEYEANKNLDTNGDGTVTRGETVASVISRTGGGAMTTPVTAESKAFLQDFNAAAQTGNVSSMLPTASELSGSAAPTAPAAGQTTTTAPTAPDAAAALPETVAAPQTDQAAPAANQPAPVDAEVQAAIKELSSTADKTFATQEEFAAAKDNGELSPGDTVVVNGNVYIIRNDGTERLIGRQ